MPRHGRILGAACALALVAGSALVSSPVAEAVSGPTPVWLGYTRLPDYQTLDTEIHVPMRDGTQMRCTLTQPTVGGIVLADRRPVVVTDYFAYRALQAVVRLQDFYAQRGYVALTCSPRGSGGTPGAWAPFQAQEAQDNYDLIEWAAVQPWSSGKVGQTGISYGGISTYKVAELNPPHLAAIIPIVAYQNLYREMVYPGGVRGTPLRWWPYFTWASSTPDQTPDVSLGTLPQYADFETRAEQHPLDDGYWKSLAVNIKAVDHTKIPILDVGGWNDLFPEGEIRNYLGAKDQSWLLMGPGAHGEFLPGVPQFDAMTGGMLAFMDHFLMGRPDAPLPDTKVTSWEMPRGTGGWVQMADWPTNKPSVLALAGPQGAGVSTQFTYAANPFDDGCVCVDHGLYNSTEYPFNDQRLSDQQRVQFSGAPTSGDLVVAGTPVAHIRAEFSEPEGVLVVRLEDVSPDGTSTIISSGWMRATHRLGDTQVAAVTPGQAADYTISLLPVHWRLSAGHAFRITISSGDLQMIEPLATPGSVVTIFAGKGGSTFDMPIYQG